MWFTTLFEGVEIRVSVFMKDIDVIQTGYDPEEDGCTSVIYTKDGGEIWIIEDEKQIDEIMAEERRRDLLFLHQ